MAFSWRATGSGPQPTEFVGRNPIRIANSKIEFVINLKAAKAMGLILAPEVLFQADRIIR